LATIDVKPTGSVEMDLGATKQDNPSFSQEIDPIYRLTSKDKHEFNGKVGTRLNVNIMIHNTFAFQI
jgi:hypothetical protein